MPDNPGPELDDALAAFGFDGDGWLGLMRQAAAGADLGSVGGYRLLEEVSRGAQGIVFRAQQEGSGRVVALKRLAAGALAGAEAKERFRREIQAEAILRHPNIVGFEGVELVQGQPLLVMEWIEGVPADRWAREAQAGAGRDRARPVREVLAVFVKICEAVSYAHQRGVIHRDLKPGNILIDAAGEPHVLDFGLARLRREGVGPEASRLTRTEGFVGTPAYAPPEQLEPGPREPDVRGDVYSLGVVLYEMLTGRRPFGDGADWEALLRAVRQESPAPPSRHEKRVDGEVDAIVLRALAREPGRRYQSVHELGADVGRYLAGEAVEARRDSAWYVLSKALRRHRAAVAGAAAFALLLVAATAVSSGLWRRAERGFAQARDQAAKAEEVSGFLEGMLASLSPERVEGRDVSLLVEVLDQAGERLESDFADRPEVQAALHMTIGQAYKDLGKAAPAEAHLRAALAIRRRLHPGDHPDVADSLHALGGFLEYQRADGNAEVRAILEETLAMRRRLFGDDHPATADSLYLRARLTDRGWEEALADFRRVLAVRRKWLGNDHRDVAHTLHVIGNCMTALNRWEEAESYYRQSLEIRRRTLPDSDRLLVSGPTDLAGHLVRFGKMDEAVALAEEGLARARRAFPAGHEIVGVALLARGNVMIAEGRPAEAEPLLREAAGIYGNYFQKKHWRIAVAHSVLGEALVALGRYVEAEPLLLDAFADLDAAFKVDRSPHHHLRDAARRLRDLYAAWDAAEPGRHDAGAERWSKTFDELNCAAGVGP